MSRNPHYLKLVQELTEIHERKNTDYASADDPYSNFIYADMMMEPFKNYPVHRVFVALLGVKLARMSQLLSGRTPLNESLADSFRDEPNYNLIWASYYFKELEKACQT